MDLLTWIMEALNRADALEREAQYLQVAADATLAASLYEIHRTTGLDLDIN